MKKLFFLSVIFLSLFSADAFAAKRYWVATDPRSWNSTARWSNTSGGTSGFSVPGSGDTAYFDGNGTGNCTINATVDVKRFDVGAGYSGTISQGANPMTIGTGNGVFSGGTFTGGSSAITCNGSFTISGTAFTSTSNTLTVVGSFVLSSGSFTHNSGTTLFTTSNTITGTIGFYNLTFTPAATAAHTISNTITANNTLTFSGSNSLTLNTGTIDALGTITITNSGTGGGGSATVNITGTASPTLTGSGTIGQGALPKVIINKSSGTLTLSSTISSANDWTWTAGTLTVTGSTVAFLNSSTIAGSHTLNNVTFQSNSATTYVISNTLTVNGTLTTAGSGGLTFNTGTIDAKGAVTLSNTGTGGGGSALITMTGGGSVNLTGNSVIGRSALPKFQINRTGTGGSVTIIDTVTAANDWTWTAGGLTTTGSNVAFLNSCSITGTHGLNNVTFASNSSVTFTITNTLTVNGILSMRGSGGLTFSTGTIDTKSTIKLHNTGTGGGGSATILISGSASLTMYGNNTIGRSALPKLTINKSGGTLTISDTISATNDWTWTAGSLTTTNSNVAFLNSLTINGTHGLNHVTFASNSSATFTITNTLTVVGTLAMRGSGTLTFNTGTIECKSTVKLHNTGLNGGGSATVLLNGNAGVTMSGNNTNSIGQSALPKITITRSAGGTLTLAGTISVANNWTRSAGGDVTPGTGKVAFLGSLTIAGTDTFNRVTFTSSATSTYAISNTIVVNDTLAIAGTGILTFTTGTIDTRSTIIIDNTGIGGGGNATITLTGSNTCNFDSNVSSNKGCLPSLTINKTGGSVTLIDTITVTGNWTCSLASNAYLTEGSSTLYLTGSKSISGDHMLNNVFIDGGTYAMTTADTMRVSGLLKYVGSSSISINTGTIISTGNILLLNQGTTGGGNGLLFIRGTSTSQTLTGQATSTNKSLLPNVEIKKDGGSITFVQCFAVKGNWTYTRGNTIHGTSTVGFTGTKSITGSDTLYDVVFVGAAATFTINSTDTVTVAGTLTMQGTNALTLNSGTLKTLGNITTTNSSTGTGGTATIRIAGTGSQTLTGSGSAGTGAFPNIFIFKSSGTLTLVSTITCAGNWTYSKGTVDASTNSSTVAFTGNFNLDGQNASTMSFWNVTIYQDTRTLTGNLDVNNDLTIAASSTLTGQTFTINLAGYWSNSGTWNKDLSTVIFDGNAHKSINKTSGKEAFYNLTLSRTNNTTLKLNRTVTVSNVLTLTKGRIVATSDSLIVLDNATLSGGHDSAYVHGYMRKTGNDAFTFPMGDTSLSSGRYHPLGITAPSSTTDQFEVRYFPTAQAYGSTKAATLQSVSSTQYWTIKRTGGTSTPTVTLGWNSNGDNTAFAEMRVAEWTGAQWTDRGQASNSVTTPTGTVTASAAVSFGANPAPLVIAYAVVNKSYAVLHKSEPASGYHSTDGYVLYFGFEDEYDDQNDTLSFSVVMLSNDRPVTMLGTTANSPIVRYGTNSYRLDLYATGNTPLAAGYYMLEVTNEKNEKWYVRFKI